MTYVCKICGRSVEQPGDSIPRQYPFCSERCRMADLGRWMRDQYVIDRELTDADLPDDPGAQDASRDR